MVTLYVGSLITSILLIITGIFVRPIFWYTASRFYRNADAIAPSELGFRTQAGVIITVGLVGTVISIIGLSSIRADEPTETEQAATDCEALVDQVGHPSSADKVANAVNNAATDADYHVESEETSEEESLDVAGTEQTITITTITWSVMSDDNEIAEFTWTESESVTGRFSSSCA